MVERAEREPSRRCEPHVEGVRPPQTRLDGARFGDDGTLRTDRHDPVRCTSQCLDQIANVSLPGAAPCERAGHLDTEDRGLDELVYALKSALDPSTRRTMCGVAGPHGSDGNGRI